MRDGQIFWLGFVSLGVVRLGFEIREVILNNHEIPFGDASAQAQGKWKKEPGLRDPHGDSYNLEEPGLRDPLGGSPYLEEPGLRDPLEISLFSKAWPDLNNP